MALLAEKPPIEEIVARFEAAQPFALDAFQKKAIEILASGKSVLVSAPTGSGKTVVAEFAIQLALATGKRCIYTTPLKALSNQKYRDLKKILGEDIGLVTGDVVISPDAPVLIMTTEILRNILHVDPTRIDDVSQVILDEAHYLGSDGRGTVWEETIVFLGKKTSITALSATIANARELADWVSGIHKEMEVVTHEERPVPLEAYVAAPTIEPLFNKVGKQRLKTFAHNGSIEFPEPPDLVKELFKEGMLPAICFIFSRMGCESQAHQVIRANLGLTDNTERSQIQEAVKAAIAQTPGMLNSNNTKRWLDSLVEGVAPHHAGLLPPLKLLIETLFQRGLIKIVFATETLAAGINMPAKTVVLSSLSKRTDDGNRNLTVGEFHQMTGRAGRRGMDKIGYVVTLASTRYSPDELVGMIRGKVEPLRSRFTLNYNMVSNLIHRYELPAARRIVEQCFSQFQNNHAVQELLLEKKKSQDRLTELTPVCPGTGETLRIDELESFRNLKSQLDSLRKRLDALESVRQYLPLRQANNLIENTPIGGWLLVHSPGTPLPQIAILLSKQPVKSGDIRYGVLLEAPNPQQLEARTIQQLGPKHLIAVLPGHRAEGLPGGLVKKSERLNYLQSQEFGNPDLPWREWVAKSGLNLEELNLPVEESPEITKARAKHQKLSDDLTGHPCARCRLKRTCLGMAKEHNLLSEAVRRNEQEVELIRSTNWRQFLALQAVLNQAGYMRERELLARGVAIAHLRTSNALIAAEAIASGRLDDLPPHALAAATSGVMAEPVRGKHYWHPMRHGEEVEDVFQHLFQIARHLQKVQEKFSVDQTVTVVSEYAGITQAWAKGAQWNQLIEPTGIDEGTLVRHLRQVIDLLTQFKEIPGLSEAFKARLMEAAHLIDRDIVKEVF